MEGVSAAEVNKAIMSAREARLNPEKSRFAQGGFTEEFLEDMRRRREMEQEFGVDFTGEFVTEHKGMYSENILRYPEEKALEEQQGDTQYTPQVITPLVQISHKVEGEEREEEEEKQREEWGDVVSEGEEEEEGDDSDHSSQEESEDEETMKSRLLRELRDKQSQTVISVNKGSQNDNLLDEEGNKKDVKGKTIITTPEVPKPRPSESILNVNSQSWEDLELRMISVGITLGSNEHSALKRKMDLMRELSLRDVIMFLEGYRACSHINEAKLSTQIDDLTKTVEVYRSHARNMDRMLSEMKGQEKAYFDLLENLTATTQARIEAEKRATKDAIARSTKDMSERKEREVKRKTKEERAKKEAEEMLRRELEQEIAHKEVMEYTKQATSSRTTKLMRDAQKTQVNREDLSETGSVEVDSDEPCLTLIILCLHYSMSPNELIKEYGRTMRQLNYACRGMPKTEELMVKKYLNMNEALNHFHRTVIRDKNT